MMRRSQGAIACTWLPLVAGVLIPLFRAGTERHWLTRAKSNTSWRVVERLGPKDEIVEMTVSHQAREEDPTLPEAWFARAIHYQRKGFPPETLLTSLTDAEKYPASELVELYHERWEIELGYDEIKTEILDPRVLEGRVDRDVQRRSPVSGSMVVAGRPRRGLWRHPWPGLA